ncbi:hypothetical protein [Pyrobaculum sp.]|uniref:hypothetical protein n=1 Tax=Pyrobaculum sp. TaxID=2004705 RepID=UPI00315E5A79
MGKAPPPRTVSRKPSGDRYRRAIDIEELKSLETRHCQGDNNCVASLRFLLLNIRPYNVEELPDFVKASLEKLDPLLLRCGELTEVSDVVEKLKNDIKNFLNTSLPGVKKDEKYIELIGRALNDILSAVALRGGDGRKFVCIGAHQPYLASDVARDFISTLLDLLMTYIAENFGHEGGARDTVEILYLIHSAALSEDRWKSATTFGEVRKLVSGKQGGGYLIIGLDVLRRLIPLYLSTPLLTKDQRLTLDELEYKLSRYIESWDEAELKDVAREVSSYVFDDIQGNDVSIYTVPIPRKLYLKDQLKDEIYNIITGLIEEKESSLKYGKTKLFILLAGGNDEVVKYIVERLKTEKPLADILMEGTMRLSIERIPGERLSDFVKSLFILIADERRSGAPSLSKVINELTPEQRRRAEYFKTLLITWLRDYLREFEQRRDKHLSALSSKVGGLINNTLRDKLRRYVQERFKRYAPEAKTYGLYYATLPRRELIKKLDLILGGGGMIRVRTLPSIYQEVKDDNLTPILDVAERLQIIDQIMQVTLGDYGDTITKAFEVLRTEDLPLKWDFADIVKRSFGIDPDYNQDTVVTLYRLYYLLTLIKERHGDIVAMAKEGINRVKNSAKSLLEVLDSIRTVTRQLCESMPLCIGVEISGSTKRPHRLEEEVEAVFSVITEIEGALKELESKKSISREQLLELMFFLAFISEGGEETLFSQLEDSLKRWYEELYEIYRVLESINNTMMDILPEYEAIRKGSPIISRPQPKDIRISSLDDIKKAKEELEEIRKEIGEIADGLKRIKDSIAESKKELRSILENIIKDIRSLERGVRPT